MADVEVGAGVQRYVERGEQMIEDVAIARAAMRRKRFDTIAVHGLYGAQTAMRNESSVIEPVYLSTAEHFEGSDHLEAALGYLMPAWGYTRLANPTTGFLEATLAMLESYGFDGDASAMVTSSGMSAVFMATNPFLSDEYGPKPNFVASVKVYGGTFQLFNERYGRERSIGVRWISDNLDLDAWEASIDENTRFLYTETPSNPGCAVSDIDAMSKIAERHGLPLIVDSTLASPALTRPLCHGADIVVHSLSKIIGAGGLSIGGSVIARHDIRTRVGPEEMARDYAMHTKLLPGRDFGPSLSPMNAMLFLNELRSLRQRADTMSQSAMKVARFLDRHPSVDRVTYPGLEGTPMHEVAKRHMRLVDSDDYRFGSLLSFEVAGGAQVARDAYDRLELIWRATDLGRVKTVAVIPSISTHQQQGEAARESASIPANLVRLSVGLEHPDDIIADLDQALSPSGRRR